MAFLRLTVLPPAIWPDMGSGQLHRRHHTWPRSLATATLTWVFWPWRAHSASSRKSGNTDRGRVCSAFASIASSLRSSIRCTRQRRPSRVVTAARSSLHVEEGLLRHSCWSSMLRLATRASATSTSISQLSCSRRFGTRSWAGRWNITSWVPRESRQSAQVSDGACALYTTDHGDLCGSRTSRNGAASATPFFSFSALSTDRLAEQALSRSDQLLGNPSLQEVPVDLQRPCLATAMAYVVAVRLTFATVGDHPESSVAVRACGKEASGHWYGLSWVV